MASVKMASIVGLMVVLVGHSAMVMADLLRAPDKASVASASERQTQVSAGKVVSIAVGRGATAQMYLATPPASPHADKKNVVRVEDVLLLVVGPGAQACIALPVVGMQIPCSDHDHTNPEK